MQLLIIILFIEYKLQSRKEDRSIDRQADKENWFDREKWEKLVQGREKGRGTDIVTDRQIDRPEKTHRMADRQ